MVSEQWSLVHDPRPQRRVSSKTHPQVQVQSSKQHGGTTTRATATGTAAGRNPHMQDITTTAHRRIQHLRRMEVQDDSVPRTARPSIQQAAETVRSQLAVINDQLETAAPSQAIAEQWIALPLSEHMRWTSIYNLRTKHARQRIGNMAADTCKVLHTWYKEHWVPYTAAKTTT